MRRDFAVMAIALMLGLGYATTVVAQPTSMPTMPAERGDLRDDSDRGFDLGWLGLLGLTGLTGLKRDRTARHDVGHPSTVR